LAGGWGVFLVVRALQSGRAKGIGGPYARHSQPINYWVTILATVLFVVMCLTYFVSFVLSK
jgi:hypothetical protein